MSSQLDTASNMFWADDPFPLDSVPKSATRALSFVMYFGYCIMFTVMLVAISTFSVEIAWISIIAVALMIAFSIYRNGQRNKFSQHIADVQQRAREQTGASTIGSMVHVAGHPLLNRNEPIVMALCADKLLIFRYDNSTPVDTLWLKDMQILQAVTYDDDRVAHSDVIDSSAQALQMTFTWQGQSCKCLLNHMKKVRPIDWYHALIQVKAATKTSEAT